MNSQTETINKEQNRQGSALILTVVLTVLLSIIGVIFVMASRLDEMTSNSMIIDSDLDGAVNTIVNRINYVLVEDLFGDDDIMLNGPGDSYSDNFGGDEDENYDYPGIDDPWLASIEPKRFNEEDPYDSGFLYAWQHITDLYRDFDPNKIISTYYDPQTSNTVEWDSSPESEKYKVSAKNVFAKIIKDDTPMKVIIANGDWDEESDLFPWGGRADADGDGVADSRWIKIPGFKSSKGKPCYAAVRIVDNNAMLNLNVAHSMTGNSKGEYLSSLDYDPFLRGDDIYDGILYARNPDYDIFANTEELYHNAVVMYIENPNDNNPYLLEIDPLGGYKPFTLFDISDELEIRNRYMLTSLGLARFELEDVAYQTFDFRRGDSSAGGIPALKVRRIPIEDKSDFVTWKKRVDPSYISNISSDDYYDRRHVCTFYSFDRNILTGEYPKLQNLGDLDKYAELFFTENGSVTNTGNLVIADGTTLLEKRDQLIQSRITVLRLLYAFRAYYLNKAGYEVGDTIDSAALRNAARKAAQIVANMIDYIDNTDDPSWPGGGEPGPFTHLSFNEDYDPQYSEKDMGYGGQKNINPTYIKNIFIKQLVHEVSTYRNFIKGESIDDAISNALDIIGTDYDFGLKDTDVVFGYERQPFISEIYRHYDDMIGVDRYAIELWNPYDANIILDDWRITYETPTGIKNTVLPSSTIVLAESCLVLISHGDTIKLASGTKTTTIAGLEIAPDTVVRLERPDPSDNAEYIVVDRTERPQADALFATTDEHFSSYRDTGKWGITDASSYANSSITTLGAENESIEDSAGYQAPVPNNNQPLMTFHDFEMVLFRGNKRDPHDPNSDPDTVTQYIANALSEGDIRCDIKDNGFDMLKYICFVKRLNGTLPGRININTATEQVIRAAIPPDDEWSPNADTVASNIHLRINEDTPFDNIYSLLEFSDFDQFESDSDNNVGDPEMATDIEERDWKLSCVANKFTVRSDVFTAYILVRIGDTGPQRRMIAIFDRSNVYKPEHKPKLVALHPVPDPR